MALNTLGTTNTENGTSLAPTGCLQKDNTL